MQVALFLRGGARNVFLQDADPCAVQTDKLVAILERLRRRFPTIVRVTTYGRAATIARRCPADLERLVAAGLTRLHLGLESGADEVLTVICKGATSAELIEAGRKALTAGLELCFYVMPGLGGRELAEAHTRGTAAVLRAVASAAPEERPLVVRLRTTAVAPGTPLADRAAAGAFVLPDDVEVAAEVRSLIEQAGDSRFELRSDHALNLLQELEGSLPADRARLLALLDEFLSLSPRERAEFALGARLGIYRRLADRHDARLRAVLEAQAQDLALASEDELLDAAARLRARFIGGSRCACWPWAGATALRAISGVQQRSAGAVGVVATLRFRTSLAAAEMCTESKSVRWPLPWSVRVCADRRADRRSAGVAAAGPRLRP
jgi:hypothetical protein